MTTPVPEIPAGLLQWLGENWARALGEVIEAMAGQKPETRWQAASAAVKEASGDATLHWQQGLDLPEGAYLWAVTSEPAWQSIGSLVLAAAGAEDSAAEEVRGTVEEILGQSVSGLAQTIAQKLGRPVNSLAGAPSHRPPEAVGAGTIEIGFAGRRAESIDLYCSSRLVAGFVETAPAEPAAEVEAGVVAQPGQAASATLDLLRDMELPVSVSFGRTELPLQDVLKLAAGSVIELDRSVSDPVALVVNNTVVALGEVVVIEGNYGLRISEIMSRERLLRSSGLA